MTSCTGQRSGGSCRQREKPGSLRLDAASIRVRNRSRINLAGDLAVGENQNERDLQRAAEVRSAVGRDTFFEGLMRRV